MLALSSFLLAAAVAHADIRPLLRAQGFEAPLNGRETIEYAGQVQQGRTTYQIYAYHGVHRAAMVDHGVSRIIVIRDRTVLFGEYDVSMPVKCGVRALRVICDGDRPGLPKSFTFTRHGPPEQIWFDGDVVRFGRYTRR